MLCGKKHKCKKEKNQRAYTRDREKYFFPILADKKETNTEKYDKEKQKLIRLVAIKNDKNFSKTIQENYKIGAIISNKK